MIGIIAMTHQISNERQVDDGYHGDQCVYPPSLVVHLREQHDDEDDDGDDDDDDLFIYLAM